MASFSAKMGLAVLILAGLILVTELKVFVYKLRYNHQTLYPTGHPLAVIEAAISQVCLSVCVSVSVSVYTQVDICVCACCILVCTYVFMHVCDIIVNVA